MENMKMDINDLDIILKARQELIEAFHKCRDYKQNKNAIMRETDHVQVLTKAIKNIDAFLGKYVEFE
tara:strand:+ start:20542 stop:20742 length:201 start_codon:yes stop_codon:yes gene_type:complete